ncbi:TonB C-terminal domain-containing protein [Tistrella bauzanensis]|uniref:TonB C-terminal domain-containing protein n=1 Tax=Tistrella arctica TaxID=3133430 RepID=A0ABU9YJA1_9PROT
MKKPEPEKKPEPDDPLASLRKSLDQLKTQSREDAPKEQQVARSNQPQQAVMQRNAQPTNQVSVSDIAFIRSQIERRWSVPVGAPEAENLIVEVRIRLAPDGTVQSADVVDRARMQRPGEESYRVAAESAVRAIRAASPLELPAGKYDQLKDIVLAFNPKNMVGR